MVLADAECNGVGGRVRMAPEGADSSDKVTPTRRLEFGNELPGVELAVARRAWEKDVMAFFVPRSRVAFTRDPLLELKLDDSQEGVERRERGGVSSVTSSLTAGNPVEVLQQTSQLQEDFNAEERHHCMGEYSECKPPLYSFPRGTLEEEEEQVVSIRGVIYRNTGMLNLHNSKQSLTRMERDLSSPRLIPTPESHILGPQGVSPATTDCAPTLVMQECSPCQGGNTVCLRSWNAQEQQDVGVVVGFTGYTFPEDNDEGCGKGASLPDVTGEGLLDSCSQDNVMGRGGVGKEEKEDSSYLPSVLLEIRNGRGVEEDTPLFHRVTAVRRQAAEGSLSTIGPARPQYTEGMRVQGRWGCQWFDAVITEEEKNGYVQIRWDGDGSLLHVKLREIRLPQEKGKRNGMKRWNSSKSNSVMTATQLVELMENETSHKLSLKAELGLTPLDKDEWVGPSFFSLYVTPAAQSRLAAKCSVLTKLKERGIFVVESPLQLERSPLMSFTGQRRAGPGVSFFVVADEDVEKDDGIIVTLAHAMGLSAISLKWLEELGTGVAEEYQHVRIPKPKDLIGQGSDACVRWRLLSSKEGRFLSKKLIYLTGDDADATFFLQVCGGTVTLQPPKDGDPLPHYVYVAPGKRAHITPSMSSVALLEKPWLVHRIHEFFFALPPSRHGQNSIDAIRNSIPASPVSGVKHPREEEEEETMEQKLKESEAVPSSTAVAVRGASRVMVASCAEAPPVLEGEDYYFRMPPVSRHKRSAGGKNEALVVELGRVVRLAGGDAVTMRIYEVKHRVLRQNPRTGALENQTTVYLGLRTANVTVADLIFSIPVYVVDASQMQHVYVLESPPRSIGATVGGGIESQQIQVKKTEEEEVSNQRCMDDKASPSVCPAGLSFGSVPGGVHTCSVNQESRALKEIVVNGWQIRPGVDVWFHDHFSSAQTVSFTSESRSKGRVQTIQCVATGVVLVLHRTNFIEDSDGSKVVVITPDMVTALV
ncbi:hypothetical protein TraAM80_10156 [Trypanosoma rangeli]|uniref:Uncharacterized protein n=1 Tax=Trypanosoma rangeli TaxID=5698 RepID=A0A3R7JUC5_TRYRA|nr:uncharacterized protein TraAM80_10156 [Trypanosoma rangeli]RNE95623.1 hypothetical protein TraAM80_10156 [Trypanosoma rangeli]|eukprot:RNE95623.1 hypothetical protein TraAM80_10156 [Trypanosoma rangeli]